MAVKYILKPWCLDFSEDPYVLVKCVPNFKILMYRIKIMIPLHSYCFKYMQTAESITMVE